ncbi:MAG: transglutaminase-like domain-containing protein [Candidatus Thermoplasmatota archaeon]|nr:transglutaminase-like domain-containing protein [Candidatus Thermoplasmatota archaeon]
MGTCPHCRAVTLPGDAVCYTCGRFLKGEGKGYSMPSAPKQRGVVVDQKGRTRNIMKRRRNRQRSVFMLAFVIFAFLSPQAREAAFGTVDNLDEYLAQLLEGPLIYPQEASFGVQRDFEVENHLDRPAYLLETVRLPLNLTSAHGMETAIDSSTPFALQTPESFVVTVAGESVNVPLDGTTVERDNAWTSSQGHEVWWPSQAVNDQEHCSITACVKIRLNMEAGDVVRFTTVAHVAVKSYTWWDHDRVDARIPGGATGINVDRSGTFDDLDDRRDGLRVGQFTDGRWYDLGVYENGSDRGYAIDSTAQIVQETSNLISMRLPEGRQDNVYAFARAAFDWMHENVPYDDYALSTPRSGPTCLADGTGDCDEQTNAYLSVLRTKGIPGWFVFGALVDPLSFTTWELHAWGYIMLPLDEAWCTANLIDANDCFVEASVDVVNNKWLLHTTNAYVDWMEEPDPSGDAIASAYQSTIFTRANANLGETPIERNVLISTAEGVQLDGGSYSVNKLSEDLR